MTSSFKLLSKCRSPHGFSLIEIIVAIAVIATLSLMLLVGTRSFYERRHKLTCQTNLRHSGIALLQLAQDNNNRLRSFHGGNNSAQMWVRRLLVEGYLFPNPSGYSAINAMIYQIQNIGDLLRCPIGNTNTDHTNHPHQWIWQAYGMGMYDQEVPLETTVVNGKVTNLYTIHLNSIASPAQYILLADSASQAPNYYQSFRISRYENTGGIALRHDKQANVFFLDGHMAAIDYKQAKALSIPEFNIFEIE